MYTFDDLIIELEKYKNKDYETFTKSLSGEVSLSYYGVKIPVLRKIVKKYDKKIDLSTFRPSYVYEVLFCYFALNILASKKYSDAFDFIKKNEKYWIGWGLTDSVYQYIKFPNDFSLVYPILLSLKKYQNQYLRRLAYLCCFKYENDVNNFKTIISLTENDSDYYVQMVESWLICDLYVKHTEETFMFLKETKLDKIIVNKAISKIQDSFRISEQDKKRAKSLRK